MEKIEKEDYKALQFFLAHNIDTVNHIKKNTNAYNIEEETEQRLLKKDLIDFKRDLGKLYYKTYYITKKGYKEFCRLREIRYKWWALRLIILTIISVGINLWLLAKRVGWL